MLSVSLLACLAAGGQALAQSVNPAQSDVRLNAPTPQTADTSDEPAIPTSGPLDPISTPPDAVAPGALTMGQLNGYRQQLAVLNFQVQIKELQAKEAQAEAQIKNAKDGNVNTDSGSPFGGVMPTNMMRPMPDEQNTSSAPSTPAFPTLQSIFGANGHMVATLNMPNGTSINAATGDTLPNNMKVVSINKFGVRVSNGKQVTTIAFGAAPRTDGSSSGGSNDSDSSAPTMPTMPEHMPIPFTSFGGSDGGSPMPQSSLDMGNSGSPSTAGNDATNNQSGTDSLGNNHTPPPGAPGP